MRRSGELLPKRQSRASFLSHGDRATGLAPLLVALFIFGSALMTREAESKAAQPKAPPALAAGDAGRGTQAAGAALADSARKG